MPDNPINICSRLLGQALVVVLLSACSEAAKDAGSPPAPAKAALTVSTTTPQVLEWPLTLKASGNIAAWQEAIIGPEINNYRITEVQANVGDVVKKGQILARIAPETVENELSESLAMVADAEATLAEARANNCTTASPAARCSGPKRRQVGTRARATRSKGKSARHAAW